MWSVSQINLKYITRLNHCYWTKSRDLSSCVKRTFFTCGGFWKQNKLLKGETPSFQCESENSRFHSTYNTGINIVHLSSCVIPMLLEPWGLPVSIGNRYFSIDQTFRISSSPQRTEQLVPANLSKNEYEQIAEETLESLTGYFDELVERSALEEADISYGSGVLTIKLSSSGTYVINKQTPNKQIWLSSPSSGPKRYDFINETWIYKHDGMSMYQLLNAEMPSILKISDIDFETNCSYGKAVKNK